MTVLVRDDTTSQADLYFLFFLAILAPFRPSVACVYSIDLARTLITHI
jgi:hypothetical protein